MQVSGRGKKRKKNLPLAGKRSAAGLMNQGQPISSIKKGKTEDEKKVEISAFSAMAEVQPRHSP